MSVDEEQLKTPQKTAFYIRVSTEEQAEMFGIDLQKEALEALVKSKARNPDGTLAVLSPEKQHIYIDDDVSGTTELSERKAFSRLQEDVLNAPEGTKPFDVVFVYKLDRLARRLRILLDANKFFELRNIKFVSAHESIDTSTPFGRAMLGIIGVIAELELETIKERTHAGRYQAIQSGIYVGSAPYGYIKDANKRLIIKEKEAVVVRQIFDLYVNKGYSIQRIATTLTKDGITVPRYSKNKKLVRRTVNPISFWHSNTVNKILSNELYVGTYYFNKSTNKSKLPKAKWEQSRYIQPTIIDRFLYHQAQSLLKRNLDNIDIKEGKHLYLLRGLLKCDCCYDAERDIQGMVAWHGEPRKLDNNKISYIYKCRRKNVTKSAISCATIPLPAEQLEKIVLDFVIQLLKDPKTVYDYQMQLKSTKLEKATLEGKLAYYKNLLNALPVRISNSKELFKKDSKHYSFEEYKKEIDELESKKVLFEHKITDISQKISELGISSNYLQALDLFSKKYLNELEAITQNPLQLYEIIHMLISEIIVYSRPVTSEDVIAGKKRENQEIPFKLDIKLKLPEQLMLTLVSSFQSDVDLATNKQLEDLGFGVKKSSW